MYALLFCFRRFIVLAFVSVLRKVCITNVWGYTEIFPFFGGREIIRGNLTRAKSAHSIIKIKTSYMYIIKNNAACFSFNNAACFTCIYSPYFLLTRNNQKHHNKYFNTKNIPNLQFPSLITYFNIIL